MFLDTTDEDYKFTLQTQEIIHSSSEQANFSVSLDVEANIVSLYSNCHNCVHYKIDK